VLVFIKLQPEIAEYIRRVVKVSNGFAAGKFIIGFVQFAFYIIVNPLLPISGPGGAAGRTLLIGRRQYGAQLFKFIAVV
jgi:hypothetical protein